MMDDLPREYGMHGKEQSTTRHTLHGYKKGLIVGEQSDMKRERRRVS